MCLNSHPKARTPDCTDPESVKEKFHGPLPFPQGPEWMSAEFLIKMTPRLMHCRKPLARHFVYFYACFNSLHRGNNIMH